MTEAEVEAAAVAVGVDTRAATSAGGMVRPALESMIARSDQGGGNILMAMTWRRERRVANGDKGTQGSEEGGSRTRRGGGSGCH